MHFQIQKNLVALLLQAPHKGGTRRIEKLHPHLHVAGNAPELLQKSAGRLGRRIIQRDDNPLGDFSRSFALQAGCRLLKFRHVFEPPYELRGN
ncbi:hypothetical protein D3C75_603980 [compost metagenome]